MTDIAFYAPMKAPDDPVPSGDRTMGRALLAALEGAGLGFVSVASRLRSRDGVGDAASQDRIFREAEAEIARLSAGPKPDLWLTYHSYYKAPDLIGPRIARLWSIPYAIVEGTRASSRLTGPYARFAKAAEAACDAADVIFTLTDYDREALERDRVGGQQIVGLRPFLASEALPPQPPRHDPSDTTRLLACAMFRSGDKLASYSALASALALVQSTDWTLDIVGDGPVRAEVEGLFSRFAEKVSFLGALDANGVAAQMGKSDLLVWPGIGEAFGMVYLEAQAQGCPVLAEDRQGVRDVVRDGGWLVPANDPAAYAKAIDRLVGNPRECAARGERGRKQIAVDHLLPAARAALAAELAPLLREQRR
ncbi:MAG: glycosyltransferase family 4 protein [Mesorhizobium sp.]|nr:glycosyltransferase family 4 protein [Mesorhizobium sp.]MBL8579464.1 glycosyltransferase family 4 protein [Mesorhizobium sp.]